MNFFQAQDNARKKTWRLAALFVAAVVSLIVMTNLLVAVVYLWTGNYATPGAPPTAELLGRMPAEYWALISAGVAGVVAVASLMKYLSLRGGGRAIAEALGGQPISRNEADPSQRRLLNVVEEMAIASGTPVPPVYLVPELSINAFAAGFGPDDAVIGINQGTLDHLNRDELQGVIGHEFSHILNGDSRINLRLIAILHGILFIGIIGYSILRGVGRGSRRSNSSGGLPVLALGLGLLIIGYAGTFFGNLIKAAVSRQREFLADAAAVQFTRNPQGIAGALKKIGGLSYGSSMMSGAANEASHMFFGQARTLFLNKLLATHPPLPRRILAIDPSWNGEFEAIGAPLTAPEPTAASAGAPAFASGYATAGPAADTISVAVASERVVNAVGELDQRGLDAAAAMIETTNDTLRDAAHDPWACRGLIHAMLIAPAGEYRAEQLALLRANTESSVYQHMLRLAPLTEALDEAHRLTLVEMAMPALKELSHNQYRRFMANAIAIIKTDAHVDLFEWVLHRLLVKELRPHFEGPSRIRSRFQSLQQTGDAPQVLLSALAREQSKSDDKARAFEEGLQILGVPGLFDAADDENFSRLNDALKTLRKLKPLAKPKLIKACAAVTLADEHVSPRQGALLQGIAAALDCPLPPSVYSPESRLP